jgi:hypothetical protein
MKTLLNGAHLSNFIVSFKLADVMTVNSNSFKPLTVNNVVLYKNYVYVAVSISVMAFDIHGSVHRG